MIKKPDLNYRIQSFHQKHKYKKLFQFSHLVILQKVIEKGRLMFRNLTFRKSVMFLSISQEIQSQS
jgi:hypothetical protein